MPSHDIAHVILVDDEPMVLSALSSLITLETPYEPVTFTQAPEALRYLEASRPADVIVSDFLMPEMGGLEFLTRAKTLRPQVPRLILTGYANRAEAREAIARAGVYRFLEKPWDNVELLGVLRTSVGFSRVPDESRVGA